MSLPVYLQQNNNTTSRTFGQYYAYADNKRPMPLKGLANHMAHHNSIYPEDVIEGVLQAMVRCVRELCLQGQPVKLDNLAIIYAHCQNKGGWARLEDVELSIGNQSSVVKAVKLCAMATGDFSRRALSESAQLELNREWKKKVDDAKHPSGDDGEPEGGEG